MNKGQLISNLKLHLSFTWPTLFKPDVTREELMDLAESLTLDNSVVVIQRIEEKICCKKCFNNPDRRSNADEMLYCCFNEIEEWRVNLL